MRSSRFFMIYSIRQFCDVDNSRTGVVPKHGDLLARRTLYVFHPLNGKERAGRRCVRVWSAPALRSSLFEVR